MEKEYIIERSFLLGMSVIGIIGLLFTSRINYINTTSGYIIFGIPVFFQFIMWIIEKVGGKK